MTLYVIILGIPLFLFLIIKVFVNNISNDYNANDIQEKKKIQDFINTTEKNEKWYSEATYHIHRYKYKKYILEPQYSELEKILKEYEDKQNNKSTIVSSDVSGDITPDEIIDKDIEFTDTGIFYKKKVWDGARYTIKKQRVFAYKREYHLDMGELPRFHICRCRTMDTYIRSGSLKLEYRKSSSKTVFVKNMDNGNKECMISNLPICGNCYRKLKHQYSWLHSKMDNEEFVKYVINRIYWA